MERDMRQDVLTDTKSLLWVNSSDQVLDQTNVAHSLAVIPQEVH